MSKLFMPPTADPPIAARPHTYTGTRRVVQYGDCVSAAIRLLGKLHQEIRSDQNRRVFLISIAQQSGRFNTDLFRERVDKLEKLIVPLTSHSPEHTAPEEVL